MNNKNKILLVDDENDILEFMEYNFVSKDFEVRTAKNGKKAVELAGEFLPDVIIMDIMMPVMDGIEACRLMRQNIELADPIIILLTARGEEYSYMAGYEAGSDDYVVKPVSMKVLIAKVRAMLNRKMINQHPLTGGGSLDNSLTINRQYYTVYKDQQEVLLPRKEFEILSYLSEEPNRLYSREEIYNRIWGGDTYVGERTLDVYIRKIRSKIGDNYIRTIKGVGYKFVQK